MSTNTVGQGSSYGVTMSTLAEVQTWIADELPRLIEKYDVPAAAVAVLARR